MPTKKCAKKSNFSILYFLTKLIMHTVLRCFVNLFLFSFLESNLNSTGGYDRYYVLKFFIK